MKTTKNIIWILIALILAQGAHAYSTDWHSPTEWYAWQSPTKWANLPNASQDGSGSATVTKIGDIAVWQGFDFDIPDEAVITGIEVRSDAWRDSCEYQKFWVKLSQDNMTTNSSEDHIHLTASEVSYYNGSSSDKWGIATWNVADVNSDEFSVAYKHGFSQLNLCRKFTSYLDLIEIRIHYQLCGYSGSGNWAVAKTTHCHDVDMVVNGNITITTLLGATTLNFTNVNLTMNNSVADGHANIKNNYGQTLLMTDTVVDGNGGEYALMTDSVTTLVDSDMKDTGASVFENGSVTTLINSAYRSETGGPYGFHNITAEREAIIIINQTSYFQYGMQDSVTGGNITVENSTFANGYTQSITIGPNARMDFLDGSVLELNSSGDGEIDFGVKGKLFWDDSTVTGPKSPTYEHEMKFYPGSEVSVTNSNLDWMGFGCVNDGFGQASLNVNTSNITLRDLNIYASSLQALAIYDGGGTFENLYLEVTHSGGAPWRDDGCSALTFHDGSNGTVMENITIHNNEGGAGDYDDSIGLIGTGEHTITNLTILSSGNVLEPKSDTTGKVFRGWWLEYQANYTDGNPVNAGKMRLSDTNKEERDTFELDANGYAKRSLNEKFYNRTGTYALTNYTYRIYNTTNYDCGQFNFTDNEEIQITFDGSCCLCPYEGWGVEWIIDEVCSLSNEVCTLNNNLTILGTGDLTFDSCNITFNNSVADGYSNLNSLNGGDVTVDSSSFLGVSNGYFVHSKGGGLNFMSSVSEGGGFDRAMANYSIIIENANGDCDINDTIINSSETAITYINSSNCNVYNNTITSNLGNGIELYGAVNLTINQNLFNGSFYLIDMLTYDRLNENVQVLDNDFYYGFAGVNIQASLDTYTKNNYFFSQNTYGVRIWNSTELAVVDNNTFIGEATRPSGIDLQANYIDGLVWNVNITNNVMWNTSGIGVCGGEYSLPDIVLFNIYVAGNYISTNGTDISLNGIYLCSVENVTVEDNYVYLPDVYVEYNWSGHAFAVARNVTGGVVRDNYFESNEMGCYFGNNSENLLVKDTVCKGDALSDVVFGLKANVTFLNVTHTTWQLSDVGTIWTVKWYLDVYVNDTDGNPVANVNVTTDDIFGTELFSLLTDAQGNIIRQNVTQKIINSTTVIDYNNHSILAKKNRKQASANLNITTNIWKYLTLRLPSVSREKDYENSLMIGLLGAAGLFLILGIRVKDWTVKTPLFITSFYFIILLIGAGNIIDETSAGYVGVIASSMWVGYLVLLTYPFGFLMKAHKHLKVNV